MHDNYALRKSLTAAIRQTFVNSTSEKRELFVLVRKGNCL